MSDIEIAQHAILRPIIALAKEQCVGWVSDSVTQRIEAPNNQVSSQVGLNAIKLNKQT